MRHLHLHHQPLRRRADRYTTTESLDSVDVAEAIAERLDLTNPDLTLALAELCAEESLEPGDLHATTGFKADTVPADDYITIAIRGENHEWLVCLDHDVAEQLAIEVVLQAFDDDPEMFEPDWLEDYIDEDKLRRALERKVMARVMDEFARRVRSDLEDLAAEMGIEVSDYQDYQDYADDDEVVLDVEGLTAAVEKGMANYASDLVAQELKHPIAFLKEMGEADQLRKFVDKQDLAQHAVAEDGVEFWLARKDNTLNGLPSGGVYFRWS